MARTVLETVALIYDARNRSDAGEIGACFHPDIVFQILGDGSLGYITEKAEGKAAFLTLLGKLMTDWDLSGLDYRIHSQDGPNVAVHRTGIIRHNPSGNRFATEIVDLLTVRDGQIVSFREFADTQQLARATSMAQHAGADASHAAIRDQVKESLEARSRGDIDGTMRHFADDCTFQIMGSEALGDMSQVIRGSSALRSLMETLVKRWDFKGVATTDLWVDGSTVVARRSGNVYDNVTGEVSGTTFIDVATFRNGKISVFEEFVDTHMVAGLLARSHVKTATA